MEQVVMKIPMSNYKLYEVSGAHDEPSLEGETDDEANPIGAVSAVSEYGAIAKLRKFIAMDVMNSEDTEDETCQLTVEGPYVVYDEDNQWDVVAYAMPAQGEEAEALHVSEYRLIKER